MFRSSLRDNFTLLEQNSVVFLLVFGCYVGAHPDGHQLISPDISCAKYFFDQNLGEGICIFTSFHYEDSGIYLLNSFNFYFDLF